MRINSAALWLMIALIPSTGRAQDSAKKELLVNVAYHMSATRIPYLQVYTKTKVEKRFLPVSGITMNAYLKIQSTENLIGTLTTNDKGEGKMPIPVSLKDKWDRSATHDFIIKSEATNEFAETVTEISIVKSKILIDTVVASETRSLEVTVLKLTDSTWVPVKDAELKVGIARLGGMLPIGEEETYTTDSTGKVVVEFKRDGLPGDIKGNLVFIAKIEDHEELGNISAEKSISWGKAVRSLNANIERSLWATRDRAPIWLLFMAGTIIFAVWATIFYLLVVIYRLKTSKQ